MLILGIETSCDETAAAILRADTQSQTPKGDILANIVSSQIALHAPYGGVVPELAARAHIAQLDQIIAQACKTAGVALKDLDAIAATAGPGLIGGLLVGLTHAQAMARALNCRFIAINHLEGHALTARLTESCAFPYLLLLVSGGHCQSLAVAGVGDYTLYGTTRDDAVGEAFDKAAKLLGLPYPGGPAIEACAKQGNPAYDLPRPLLGQTDKKSACDFSFSGLKTALRHCAEKLQPITPQIEADLAASFQSAVLDCLADRSRNAMREFSAAHGKAADFVIAGGVAANQALRARLKATAEAAGFTLRVAPPALCTDNAAMIAWAGVERICAGLAPDLTTEKNPIAARARWPLDS